MSADVSETDHPDSTDAGKAEEQVCYALTDKGLFEMIANLRRARTRGASGAFDVEEMKAAEIDTKLDGKKRVEAIRELAAEIVGMLAEADIFKTRDKSISDQRETERYVRDVLLEGACLSPDGGTYKGPVPQIDRAPYEADVSRQRLQTHRNIAHISRAT